MNLYLGVNITEKHYKYTDDKDCLSPDIHLFRNVWYLDWYELMQAILILEENGYDVCVDTKDHFYETEGVR